MKRLLAIAMLLCFTAFSGAAEEARVAVDGFSFVPPGSAQAQALTSEAQESGVVYAAQSEDGSLRVVVTVERLRRSAAQSTAELVAQMDESLEPGRSVEADGTDFALYTQTMREGKQNVYFRAATAVREGKRYTLFFVDRDGAHEDEPARAAASVLWTE